MLSFNNVFPMRLNVEKMVAVNFDSQKSFEERPCI